jgi:hypothetical protein
MGREFTNWYLYGFYNWFLEKSHKTIFILDYLEFFGYFG